MATDVLDGAPPAPMADEPPRSERPARVRDRRRWLWVTVAVVGLGGLGAGAFVGYETASYAAGFDGRILPSSVVAGVDVAGLTGEEALAAVHDAIAPELERTVTLTWGSEEWTTTPRALGATSDAEEAVSAAVEASANPGWIQYARMRWLDEQIDFERAVTVRHSDEGARAFVDTVAEEVNREPVDATLDASSGWVEITAARDGQALDTAGGAEALHQTVTEGGDAVALEVHPVAAEVTQAAFDQVLLVRQREHKLYLYQGGEIAHSWDVAVGTGDHPTPTGQYTVTAKRHMPTWVNPSPAGWGAHMPASIGPGPGNPLGVRAINWDAPAIRFHGTANVDSIGTDASKGCVRLTNEDVVELYDLVRTGATIVSVQA